MKLFDNNIIIITRFCFFTHDCRVCLCRGETLQLRHLRQEVRTFRREEAPHEGALEASEERASVSRTVITALKTNMTIVLELIS